MSELLSALNDRRVQRSASCSSNNLYLRFMEHGDGSTSKSQRSLEMYPSPCSSLHDNIGNSHSQGEIQDRDQVRQSTLKYSMFPRSNLQGDCSRKSYCQRCLEDTQGSVGRAKGQESYTKIYLLTLFYTTKLEEGPFDVDGYVQVLKKDILRSTTPGASPLRCHGSFHRGILGRKILSPFHRPDVRKGFYQDTEIPI